MDVVEGLEAMARGYIGNLNDPLNTDLDSEEYAAFFIIQEAIKEINRLRGNFKRKVVDLMNAFVKATGDQPTRIFIPKSIERDIMMLKYDDDDIGVAVNALNAEGTRAVFSKTILGLKVTWDAEEFKVE